MMTAPATPRLHAALSRITHWMRTHGAPLLVENLAPGATSSDLAAAEAHFGIPLPADLRALWSLHNGQREDGTNGFLEIYCLLSAARSVAEHETVLASIEFAREDLEAWPATGGTLEELHSVHWLPFAAIDSDSLVVHGLTGRVFRCDHDDSPACIADSLVAWFEAFAARVEADDYAVEEGFGDYYLSLRNRNAERAQLEHAQHQADHERMRRETPLLDQFRAALTAQDAERCLEVLQDARAREDKAAFEAAVALLFAGSAEPKFVASALRPLLNAITLTPDQWADVAIGGALLENNAVRDVALPRAANVSTAHLAKLEALAAGASSREQDAIQLVLQKLQPSPPSVTSDAGNWFSRWFKRPPGKA